MTKHEILERLELIREKIRKGEYPMLSIDALIREIQIDLKFKNYD